MHLLLVCKRQVIEKRAEASLATHACPLLFGVCLMLNFFLLSALTVSILQTYRLMLALPMAHGFLL